MRIEHILSKATVLPVLELPTIDVAVPLARSIAEGGINVIELTLRTDCALEAISVIKDAVPEMIVGMGTIRTNDDVERAIENDADFLVSPGTSPGLIATLAGSDVPALPGVATASEAMTAFEAGFNAMKFFPAEPSGGTTYLKALVGPLPDIVFCPTGSITPEMVDDYLRLPNVACVGGSWIATKDMIANQQWDQITANAKRAEAMRVT